VGVVHSDIDKVSRTSWVILRLAAEGDEFARIRRSGEKTRPVRTNGDLEPAWRALVRRIGRIDSPVLQDGDSPLIGDILDRGDPGVILEDVCFLIPVWNLPPAGVHARDAAVSCPIRGVLRNDIWIEG
jgi:hypothetical protein